MSKLKPCPFCDCEGRMVGTIPKSGIWYVSCTGCHASTQPHRYGEEGAITAWNTRATPAWISVEDRLPLTDTYVLTWGFAETATQMLYTRHNGEDYWDCRNIDKHYLLSQNPITHWMPLPDAP